MKRTENLKTLVTALLHTSLYRRHHVLGPTHLLQISAQSLNVHVLMDDPTRYKTPVMKTNATHFATHAELYSYPSLSTVKIFPHS